MSMVVGLPNFDEAGLLNFDGKFAQAFTIGCRDGLHATILPYGAIVQALYVPCDGVLRQVLANYNTFAQYEADTAYVGCVIGRTANRIRDGKLNYEGETFVLDDNEVGNHLHGGAHGFSRRLWSVHDVAPNRLMLNLLSPAGDQGYPGTVTVTVRFEIISDACFSITYEAFTDAPSPIDLTHHLYFNLGAAGHRQICHHTLTVSADHVLELDDAYLPNGDLIYVGGTPFDLRSPRQVSDLLYSTHPQLTSIGLNQAWILDGSRPNLRFESPDGRLRMCVGTNQACVQLYSGLSASLCVGGAMAIEPQGYIDAVSNPMFPSPWVMPDQRYSKEVSYCFSTPG
jgi:aldose 1-epimerase